MPLPTTKGFLGLILVSSIAVVGAAIHVNKDKFADKEDVPIEAPSSETVVSPPTVEVIDPFVEEVLDIEDAADDLIDTMSATE